jgi:hypothetical protein
MAFFSYHLASDGETVPVEKSFAYPVVTLIFGSPARPSVRSDQLESRESVVSGPTVRVLCSPRYRPRLAAQHGVCAVAHLMALQAQGASTELRRVQTHPRVRPGATSHCRVGLGIWRCWR